MTPNEAIPDRKPEPKPEPGLQTFREALRLPRRMTPAVNALDIEHWDVDPDDVFKHFTRVIRGPVPLEFQHE